jgi:hypothetical protein
MMLMLGWAFEESVDVDSPFPSQGKAELSNAESEGFWSACRADPKDEPTPRSCCAENDIAERP